MTDLTPITALGHLEPQSAKFGMVELRENNRVALASLALRRDRGIPRPFGLDLPPPSGWTQSDTAGAFWTGPDQWMILIDDRAQDDIVPHLSAQAPGCSITEQTDGWVAFEVTTPDLRPLLERLVNIDLERFPPGSATRSTIEHMSVYLVHRSKGQATILGMRSVASSLWHALTTVAARL